ncbi:MAG: metallophosphoesterase [Planctomycetota bacterium]
MRFAIVHVWAWLALSLAHLVVAQDLNTEAIERITAQPGERPFTFVLIGDPQGRYETFKKLLEQCAGVKPRFIIVLGDLTPQSREEEFDAYVSALREAPAPVVSLIGNHDIHGDGRALYEARFGKPDRRFDYAGCRFILLDTAAQKVTREQADWLEGALKTENRKFVAMHCPPYLGNWWYYSFTTGSRRFLELMRDHKVRRVFMGHLHMVDSLHYEGVDYLVCGSGGISPMILPFGRAVTCFVSVTVAEDGEKIAVHPAH